MKQAQFSFYKKKHDLLKKGVTNCGRVIHFLTNLKLGRFSQERWTPWRLQLNHYHLV